MRVSFEREATLNAMPISGLAVSPQPHRFDCKANAETSIAAISRTEGDRLLRQAYRMVRRVDSADPEGIVSDATLWMLGHWKRIKDEEHCRKLFSRVVRNLCLNVLRIAKDTVQADARLADPESITVADWTPDAIAWLLDQCDDTERKILQIYMVPGNQTAEAVAEQTQHWVDRWTPADVWNLFRRLRKRIGVTLPQWRSTGFTTCGTLPGWHTERVRSIMGVLAMSPWSGPELPAWPRQVSLEPVNSTDSVCALLMAERAKRRVWKGTITV